MARDPRYDILFEPVPIGPVTAPNRFYQVAHCNGMGYRFPGAVSAMRAVKAQGGWGVVCTEEIEIHHTSELSPYAEGRMWDDRDLPTLAATAAAIHEHGSLAAIELAYNGRAAANRTSRDIPLAPSHVPVASFDPIQARAMLKRDIRDVRIWHRQAALRARRAGFDVVYVYAGHGLGLPMQFLSRRFNQRSDEYGGPLENRMRLFRELIEDTREAIGDTCAVAVRLAVDELLGEQGIAADEEGRDIVGALAELPDLWDVNVSDWSNDSATSRFAKEGFQEEHIAFVKTLTTKPVVGVGRFTSPDAMVSQIKRGIVDLIGAARPSIADPFLPRKIEEGRPEDIRECIGCNVCVSGDTVGVPIRCTQNPTMGEEWRRGWHPEWIPARISDDAFLVVGAGPAGLECARALGQRGYAVTVAEARGEVGGRVTLESRLPGLAEWARVRDYRTQQLVTMANVDLYPGSELGVDDILEFGAPRVVLATGSRWLGDGTGRHRREPVPGAALDHVYTPDDMFAGADPPGPVVVFDDDHYYLGAVLAEWLRQRGREVVLATPATEVSAWTRHTLEQHRIQSRLIELGVGIVTGRGLARIGPDDVELDCVYSGGIRTEPCASVVLVTSRAPRDELFQSLHAGGERLSRAGVRTLDRIGDCLGPGTIAAAVYSGHRLAREVDAPVALGVPFARDSVNRPVVLE